MVRTVERIIAQNDAVLRKYDDEYTPASEVTVSTNSGSHVTDPESVDLFE
ncbi:hypothetical protein PN416_16970 [Halorubrum ezzemoulense]|nr:hypothetical protein [Halorubrum ezzemoulense]MDB9281542.1 hypothetical protein [Halorubrum ezzemoulense]MDB9285089.1 hypothetical protein [Halorubrum ezzemoulense]